MLHSVQNTIKYLLPIYVAEEIDMPKRGTQDSNEHQKHIAQKASVELQ